ncbi:hypothetical protein QE152_g36624 [Popillia japonica]|uniref:Uncharacterized protein n=1 Tax=Popillia japonica TaxID=7064 RepID=A0AAW1IC44_POPJA
MRPNQRGGITSAFAGEAEKGRVVVKVLSMRPNQRGGLNATVALDKSFRRKYSDRAYATHDMAYATTKHQHVVCEPNKNRVKDNIWLKDRRVNVVALFLTRRLDVENHLATQIDGNLYLECRDFLITCCYISSNIPLSESENELERVTGKVRGKNAIVQGTINAKSSSWGSSSTDNHTHLL